MCKLPSRPFIRVGADWPLCFLSLTRMLVVRLRGTAVLLQQGLGSSLARRVVRRSRSAS